MSKNRQVLPLSERLYDILHIFTFVMMFIIAYTVDIVAGSSPSGSRLPDGSLQWGVTMEVAESAYWPPKFMFQTVIDYCKKCDIVFCMNPMWMKVRCLLCL
jgi:hypothetical protein